MAVFLLLYILLPIFLFIVPMWKIFTKAGKPGWAVLIPIYNVIVMLQVAKKPWWWIFLFIIPLVNIVFLIMMWHAISKAFGKDVGYTIGLILFPVIFVPILGYGSAQYQREEISC